MNWREKARPIIARILAENAGLSERELRKVLREKFPWGPRQYHPYKTWLDEINVQLGKKKPKVRQRGESAKKPVDCDGQAVMFLEDQ